MKSNIDKSLDRLRRLFWLSALMNFFICPLVSIIVLTCSQSLFVAGLTLFLLLCITTALAEYKRLQIMTQALDNFLKSGTS